MKSELYDFDYYPMVFLTEKVSRFTVHSRQAGGCGIYSGVKYLLRILENSLSCQYAGSQQVMEYECTGDENGCICADVSFPREGLYLVSVIAKDEDREFATLHVYALEHDMEGMYPFRGDLHMHTCRSDGHNDSLTVASEYRIHGYDFTVISDHHRYYPSLETRKALHIGLDDESDITDFLVVQGEEVHLPYNPAHYVNFGGRYSINALVSPSPNGDDRSDDPCDRSLDGKCPPTITHEEFGRIIAERAEKIPLELESERLSYAVLEWIYEKIQDNGGLGIFPHPYWMWPTMQISESFTEYIYKNHPFDAFEVLGGENYYQHNGFQTGFYYDMKAKGYDYPVVGSTDSHGCTENNRNSMICSTLVFAKENKTEALIAAIKSKRSVAVDTISAEYRLVGDFRWMKYGSFLMENWFPLHDRFCKAEGCYMRLFADGDPDGEKVLKAMKGRIPSMLGKYFDL